MVRRDRIQRHVAHPVEDIVVRHVPGRDEPDAALVEPALDELLHELSADTRGNEHEERIGLEVGDLLQEGREVGVLQRHA
jgi:hypothetical protein